MCVYFPKIISVRLSDDAITNAHWITIVVAESARALVVEQ